MIPLTTSNLDTIFREDLLEIKMYYCGATGPLFFYRKESLGYWQVCYKGHEFNLADSDEFADDIRATEICECFKLLHDPFGRKARLDNACDTFRFSE